MRIRSTAGGRGAGLLSIVALCLLCPVSLRPDEPAVGATHALLINGGSKPASNYLSHLNHLQEMVEMLERRGVPRRRIHVFSADGEELTPDLAVRDALPETFWLIEGTRVGEWLRPRTEVTDTRWPGVALQPARKVALRAWFEGAGEKLVPGDRLLLFVTDHGTRNDEDLANGAISLWQEEITVEEMRELLALLPANVRVTMMMSQCYSGSFANAMYQTGSSEPSGDVCGFFSTRSDLRAYGCYPEGRDRDRIGHAFRFIDGLNRQETSAEAHQEVLITDSTPDVPLRTSDVYIERLVAAEARARGSAFEALVDSLLAEAWRERAAWEPQIRLLDRIGESFGTFSPRGLAELETYSDRLPPLTKQMEVYAQQWQNTLVSVQEETLISFVGEYPEWRERLEQQAVRSLDREQRKELLAELLPELEWHALDQPELWRRLEGLRERARRASEAQWRLDVRQSALLRMRSILIGVAGQVMLAKSAERPEGRGDPVSERAAFEELLSCESLDPGELPATQLAEQPSIEPYPPLADELRLMEEIVPSWMGVRFGAVSKTLRTQRNLTAGATLLRAVYPDSPASEAGLEPGDIVLGPPEAPFDAPGQLREWAFTSPQETALPMMALRPGVRPEEDLELEVTLSLRPYPMVWPELPGPPQVGDAAPALSRSLQPVDASGPYELEGRPHLLFFWATWCLPCKKAVPEVMAYAAAEGVSVVAISDEDTETVRGHLEQRREAFFAQVATDPLRRSFISYGVSGTPTIVLVDEEGVVRHRQVGYSSADGLKIEGWSWSGS